MEKELIPRDVFALRCRFYLSKHWKPAHVHSSGSVLCQRRRRWHNTDPQLGRCFSAPVLDRSIPHFAFYCRLWAIDPRSLPTAGPGNSVMRWKLIPFNSCVFYDGLSARGAILLRFHQRYQKHSLRFCDKWSCLQFCKLTDRPAYFTIDLIPWWIWIKLCLWHQVSYALYQSR